MRLNVNLLTQHLQNKLKTVALSRIYKFLVQTTQPVNKKKNQIFYSLKWFVWKCS